MVKKILVICLIVFCIISCNNTISQNFPNLGSNKISDLEHSINNLKSSKGMNTSTDLKLIYPTNTATVEYDKTAPFITLDNSSKSVTITGLKEGQHIYLSKINPSQTNIYGAYSQFISDATNITLSEEEHTSIFANSDQGIPNKSDVYTQDFYSINPKNINLNKDPNFVSPRTVTTKNTKVTQLNTSKSMIGKLEKDVYIDASLDLSTYKKAKAVLRASGDLCNVWVVKGYYETETPGSYTFSSALGLNSKYTTYKSEQLTKSDVENICNKFEAMYQIIRDVFGEESDKIYYDLDESTNEPTFTKKDMSYLSDTGTKINIIAYDISMDFNNTEQSGVMGYFYSKDYYPNSEDLYTLTGYNYGNSVLNYSNEGKYFYIDAGYAKNEETKDMLYSTLAHEFQHMIAFGQKTMNQNIIQEQNIAEMMSMLCEDLLINHLGTAIDDSPINRLPYFCANTHRLGIEYVSDYQNAAVLSYATNYAFGAWIVREFGGKDVVKEMAKNKWGDNLSIVKAVNTINGTDYCMKDLLMQFTQALIYSKPLADVANPIPTLNKSIDDATYPLVAIDLWNLDKNGFLSVSELEKTYVENGLYSYTGPSLLAYNHKGYIRPNGFNLIDVGSVTSSGSVTITFGNTCIDERQCLYIFIE